MPKRTYLVTIGNVKRLVKAATRAQAVNHVVADTITASVATQDDLEELLPKGIPIERPGGKAGDAQEGQQP
jgi:hypothetical protein